MRSKLLSSASIAIVAMLVLSMLAIFPASAATTVEVRNLTDTGNTFYFNTATTPVNTLFQVDIWVKSVSDLFGYQLNITYNPAHLLVTAATRLNNSNYVFYTSYGPMVPLGPTYNVGNVIIGMSLTSDPANFPFTGSGTLARITFKIIAPPPKLGFLQSAIDVDTVGTFTTKLKDSGGGAIAFTDVDGDYKYTWSEPATKPYFKVVPPTTTFGPFPPSAVGQVFTVDIKIMTLDSAWGLIAADMVIEFNNTLIDFTAPSVTWNPLWLTKSYAINYNADPTFDNIVMNVSNPSSAPSGDVLVATLTFMVMYQGSYPAVDISPLHFVPADCKLWDPPGPALIPQKPGTPEDGQVVINGLLTLPMPLLKVVPATTTLGPDLVVGDQFLKPFEITVTINNLHPAWYLVGLQFRLTYDDTLVEVMSYSEGPFLPAFNNTYPPPYTFPIAFPHETIPNVHFLFGDLLLPNATGRWNVFPSGSGTLLKIKFKPIKQSWVDTYSFGFNLYDIKLTGIKDPAAVPQEIQHIPAMTPQNGTYTILPIAAVGRRIDVWMQYPAPYGGQGLMQPADLVVPQQLICLTAKVTYNWWPVAQKKVTFNIYDNNWGMVTVLEAITGDDGHATTCFRMPWPNVNPESLFGVWRVYATASVADVTILDILQFHYDYLVRITSVTTNKLEYMHLEQVEITIAYKSHAQQTYTVWLTATIQDNLLVPIGLAYVSKVIGGATFCSYKVYPTVKLTITIPYWAYAGSATVRVNFLDKSPMDGLHVAVTPEATKLIYILPL